MTKGTHVMHSEAERLAVSIGPRISNINGQNKAAYYLTKKELKNLFTKNGFNTNGVAWLKMIVSWKETWEEIAPSEGKILNRDEDWNVYFIHINVNDLTALKMFAEDQGTPMLAVGA